MTAPKQPVYGHMDGDGAGELVCNQASNVYVRKWDGLNGNPFWTAPGAAARLGVAFTTAQRAVLALERAGILEPTSTARRNRVYCARAILDILEEPARLGPGEHSGRRPSRE